MTYADRNGGQCPRIALSRLVTTDSEGDGHLGGLGGVHEKGDWGPNDDGEHDESGDRPEESAEQTSDDDEGVINVSDHDVDDWQHSGDDQHWGRGSSERRFMAGGGRTWPVRRRRRSSRLRRRPESSFSTSGRATRHSFKRATASSSSIRARAPQMAQAVRPSSVGSTRCRCVRSMCSP